MWIFTPVGFVSIVQDTELSTATKKMFLVRARQQDFLKNILAEAGLRHPSENIRETPDSDYRFRVSITTNQLAELMVGIGCMIDYSNFKNACKVRGRYANMLSRIWELGADAFGAFGNAVGGGKYRG